MELRALNRHIKQGNIDNVGQLLGKKTAAVLALLNTYDESGYTPLMYAVKHPHANIDLLRLLLARGANVHASCHGMLESGHTMISLALAGGDPDVVALLIEQGANVRYARCDSFDALLDAVHNRDVYRDARLIPLLKLLIENGVALNTISCHQESGLRVLSRIGRFDAVKVLLDAGADAAQLGWSPLMRAIALGTLGEVEHTLAQHGGLNDRDWWERTPWLLAIQTGDIDKANFLFAQGADTAACGRCEKPSIFYAIECGHASMLAWLIDIGISLDQVDRFGTTPLAHAVEFDCLPCVAILLQQGVALDAARDGQTALCDARSREMAIYLLDAGADPAFLSIESRRTLLGFSPEPDGTLLDVALNEFIRARKPRFGTANPTPMQEPFWQGMLRSGVNAYQAAQRFKTNDEDFHPVWCAQRFGQSISFLENGLIVQIAGEHEDSYDPDFYIYNDVFVHHPDGTIQIYGYPEAIFPPTDFHTATLVGDYIYIIGSLGNYGARQYSQTPVYRLDTRNYSIARVSAQGDNPGWIYKHRANLISDHEIQIQGGTIVSEPMGEERFVDNETSYILDLASGTWRVCA